MYIKNDESQTIIAESTSMQAVLKIVKQVAPTEVTVLITGETGVGKDVIARAIHNESERKNGPFRAINCANFSPELLSTELFGHEIGSFTGAIDLRRGVFEQADGGTLFLDEVGEMSPDTQTRFLRVLEDQIITRVGGEVEIKVDVRIVAATNADLETKMQVKEFRDDLYYRLYVIPIFIPPLRERRADILPLTKLFISEFREKYNKRIRITPEVLRQLEDADWPGNIRQLQRVIQAGVILAKTEELKFEDFPDAPGDPKRLTNPGIARGGRRDDTQRSKGFPRETGTVAFENDTDAVEKLWDFIWTSYPEFDDLDAYIFQMIYKKHFAENDGNEKKAREATHETLKISPYEFKKHLDIYLKNPKNNPPKNIENRDV